MSRSACWPGTPQENARRGRPVVEPAGLGSDLIAVSPLAADPVARPLPGGGWCGLGCGAGAGRTRGAARSPSSSPNGCTRAIAVGCGPRWSRSGWPSSWSGATPRPRSCGCTWIRCTSATGTGGSCRPARAISASRPPGWAGGRRACWLGWCRHRPPTIRRRTLPPRSIASGTCWTGWSPSGRCARRRRMPPAAGWPPKRVGSDSRQRRLDRRRSGSTGGGAGLSGTASRFAIIRELGLAITPPARAAPARISSEPHARSGWLGPNVERHDQTGQRMLRTRTSLVAAVALCLLLASCSGAASGHSKPTTNSSVTSPPASSTGMAAQPGAGRICGRVAKPPTTWAHVIWIWMENHDYADLVGNPQAPYENNALIGGCGLAANYHNITHPSLPNYIAATSGHPQVDSDCSPSACATTALSLFDQLREAGKTWRAYEESMPANCAAHDTGAYAAQDDRHTEPPQGVEAGPVDDQVGYDEGDRRPEAGAGQPERPRPVRVVAAQDTEGERRAGVHQDAGGGDEADELLPGREGQEDHQPDHEGEQQAEPRHRPPVGPFEDLGDVAVAGQAVGDPGGGGGVDQAGATRGDDRVDVDQGGEPAQPDGGGQPGERAGLAGEGEVAPAVRERAAWERGDEHDLQQ